MYTPIDEIVMQNLGNYMTRSIVSIEGKDVSTDDTKQMDWWVESRFVALVHSLFKK